MRKSSLILVTASILLLLLLIILIPWYPWQLIAGILLLAFLPGYALLAVLWPPSTRTLTATERGLIAAPVSFSLTIVYLLLLVLVRLPLNIFSVAGGLGAITLLLIFIGYGLKARDRATGARPYTTTRSFFPLLFILFLAAFFRLGNIHYSDYQGDEADILLRAVSLVYGQTDAILTHSKGPGEILLLDAIGAFTGRFDEQTARLPFALAGIISVGLLTWLGQQLFNRWVGWVAGMLAAIDGVFISYARTAQYQSLVLLLTLATIYCFYRFYQSQTHRWHRLGAFLLAASFLFHFEIILLLPLFVYLTFTPMIKQANEDGMGLEIRLKSYGSRLVAFWPSALIFVTLVALFYGPFLLHPSINSTGAYLENRVGGGSTPPFNNLAHFFYYEALKYNSAYYVILFNTLLVGVAISYGIQNAIVTLVRQWKSKRVMLVGISILSGVILVLATTSQLAAWLPAFGFGSFFALVILSPFTSLPQRLLWLWLAPPFWVYVFLVNRPGKHHYLFLGALTLLVAWAIVQGWLWITERWPILKRPAGRRSTVGLGLVLLTIFAGNSFMIFLRSDLEYILTYPAHKSFFYPTDANFPYDTRIGFGYPFRLGWQLIGQLRRTGQLNGDWGGNDDGNAPRWYMSGLPYTPCYPHYIFRGRITYKGSNSFDVPFNPADFGYRPIYRLWGNGRLQMTVLEFDPAGQTKVIDLIEPFRFAPPATAADFAALMSDQAGSSSPPKIVLEPPLVLGEGSELKNNAPAEYIERAKYLNGRVALVGYDIEKNYIKPGGIVPITLYWQSQNLLNLRYKVFTHLTTEDRQIRAQADDFPLCGASPTNTWLPGNLTLDRHLLKLPLDLPPGNYTLVVGMYEPDLNLRLNYFDVAGNEQGNSLIAGTIQIQDN